MSVKIAQEARDAGLGSISMVAKLAKYVVNKQWLWLSW